MGFLDKLKDAGKEALKASGVKITKLPKPTEEDKNATYIKIDDFLEDGSVQSEFLPKTGNLFYFSIDADKNEVVIVERVPKGIGHKYKVVRNIPVDDIVTFRALEKKVDEYETYSRISYKSAFVCTSGEAFVLSQSYTKRFAGDITSLTIREEMKAVFGLNKVLLLFITMLDSDEYTKQWYNEIYAERGTGPVFDENGQVDVMAYLDMHNNWFETQNAEWQRRLKSVQI